MKKTGLRRILSAVMAFVMLLTLLPSFALAAPATYTLDVTKDLDPVAKGSKVDGDTQRAGTDKYFTVFYSETAQINGSNKNFSDGYSASQRIHFGSGTKFVDGNVLNAIGITTNSPATVKVWWVNNEHQVVIFRADGSEVTKTNETPNKNGLCISELSLPEAGTYYIGNAPGVNYFFRIDVTEENPGGEVGRPGWANVAAPVVSNARDLGDGQIEVTVDALVGAAGGDELTVSMLDKSGKVIFTRNIVAEKSQHKVTFAPIASGDYTLQAELRRDGEAEAKTSQGKTISFVLPLAKPLIVSGISKGAGKIQILWTSVDEATGYEVFMNGASMGTTDKTNFMATGLTVGQEYTFQVTAIRGGERTTSEEMQVAATQDEKTAWGFTYYGPSTNGDHNGYVGDLNADGDVTVYSEGGKGKIVPGSTDGLAFYYTAVPTEYNFTLRAKVTVDSWTLSNGQEGFGLMAADRLGELGNSAALWNNQYMALASKIEYRYDLDNEELQDLTGSGTKYTMKLGLGTLAKTGITKENLPMFEQNDTDTINKYFLSQSHALEYAAGFWKEEAGTYNIIGNYTGEVSGSIEQSLLTEFDLEIQKNNTGYFITYYDAEGNVVTQRKYYGAEDLNQLDKDYVYVGFFAARNARATFSDVQFSTILASEDAPAEERPKTEIVPTISLYSSTVTTDPNYKLSLYANVSGTLKITVDGTVVAENDEILGEQRYTKEVTLPNFDKNRIQVTFTPDPEQYLGPDTVLSSTDKIYLDENVVCNKGLYHRKTIYASPTGLPNGAGTREYPFDIYTAVNNAVPGQTIVLLEGTYKLESTLRIQRGMDGTAAEPIRMIADPEAKTRPVLDFKGMVAGIVHGGSYWYFAGFDVTNSQPGQKGFQISGSYNVLDQIHTYRNGNSGIQISRYSGADTKLEDWPSYNLVLNCTSYLNADPGEEDADGFAAKLTCGVGNVFDGCVAYNNADDGWDLYAKVETGCIGAVTIRNCVAYNNGLHEDGTPTKGNGNGFKMGGDSLSGKHVLENSIAFNNKAKGIDSNSCPDIIVKNCVSYNNGSYNVALYTNNAGNTDFAANGIISFKDSSSPFADSVTQGDNLKPKGSQEADKYNGPSNYYWAGTACVNSAGKTLGPDIFVSLEFKGVARKADGTLDMQGFLEVNGKAPADAGARMQGQPSRDMTTLGTDAEHTYSTDWYTKDNLFHWHECECGDRGSYGAHELVWITDKEATETTNGQKHQECTVCGHKKPAVETYFGQEDPVDPSAPTEPNAGTQPGAGPNGGVIVAIVAGVLAVLAAAAFVLIKKGIIKLPAKN